MKYSCVGSNGNLPKNQIRPAKLFGQQNLILMSGSVLNLPTLSRFSCITMAHSESAMLHMEAFPDLCRRAAVETDPTALERIKDA